MESGSSPEGKPPRGLASAGATSPARRYSVYVGVAFIALAIFALINSLSTDEGGLLGSDPAEAGAAMAPFAVPEALGPLVGDANVFQDDCETSRNPCPPEDRRTPACEVSGEDLIRVCDLFDRPLVISFWFTRGGECEAQQDAFETAYRRHRDEANFLGINVRDDRDEVADLIAERGWTHPIGRDPDGALSNLYRVGGCPTFLYAFPGGILSETSVGELSAGELSERVERLIRESRERVATVR
jgi:hypothetical protein